MKTKRPSRASYLILVVAGLMFSGIFVAAGINAYKHWSLENHLFEHGVRTQAFVESTGVEIDPRYRNRAGQEVPRTAISYVVDYTFRTPEGSKHFGEGNCSSKEEFKRGDSLEIVYLKDHPSENAPLRQVAPSVGNTIFWSFGSIFILVMMTPGIFLIYSGIRAMNGSR